MPYSDNPSSSVGGYSDFPDPPTSNDNEYQDGPPQGHVMNHPDSTLFSFLADINNQNRSSSPVSNNSDESSDGLSLSGDVL